MNHRQTIVAPRENLERRGKKPELLVSVRSMAEFRAISRVHGIDIIDLKEPRQGALAPASPELWESIAACPVLHWAEDSLASIPLSAALGEFDQAKGSASQLPAAFKFAKMGPSDTQSEDVLQRKWDVVHQALPPSVELVAVAYADFHAARTLSPQTILSLAAKSGFRRILIDTFIKDGRSTIDHLNDEGLADFARKAAEQDLWWALAGSIQIRHVDELESRQGSHGSGGGWPDCIGVRGILCEGDRAQELSVQRCQSWVARFSDTGAGHW